MFFSVLISLSFHCEYFSFGMLVFTICITHLQNSSSFFQYISDIKIKL